MAYYDKGKLMQGLGFSKLGLRESVREARPVKDIFSGGIVLQLNDTILRQIGKSWLTTVDNETTPRFATTAKIGIMKMYSIIYNFF